MWGYEILQERERVWSMLKGMKKLNFSNEYISTILHCAACDVHSHLENTIVVHNKKEQGFTYHKSL